MQTGENGGAGSAEPGAGQNRIAESRVRVRATARGMGILSGADKTAAKDRAKKKRVGKHDPPAAAPRLRQAAGSGAMRTGCSTEKLRKSVAGPRAATVARIHCDLLCMSPGHHARNAKMFESPTRSSLERQAHQAWFKRNLAKMLRKCRTAALPSEKKYYKSRQFFHGGPTSPTSGTRFLTERQDEP